MEETKNPEGAGEEKTKADQQEVLQTNNRKRWLILFVLGLLIGFTLKVQLSKYVVIGYEDYKLADLKDDFSQQVLKEEPVDETEQAVEEETEAAAEDVGQEAGGQCQ